MTTIPTTIPSKTRNTSGLLGWVRQHPLTAFFVLAFAGTWLIADLPLILAQNGLGLIPVRLPYEIFVAAGTALGVAGSAFLVTAIADGKKGVMDLLRRYTHWRVPVRWYLFLLFYPVVLLSLALLLRVSTPGDMLRQAPQVLFQALAAAVSILIIGQLWEEVGWRGFALPRLQPHTGALKAALFLGLMQALWHIPGFFFAGGMTPPDQPLEMSVPIFFTMLAATLLGSLIFSILSTWLYNKSGASLFIVILFHTLINTSNRITMTYIADPMTRAQINGMGNLVLLVLVIVILVATRARLGYRKP